MSTGGDSVKIGGAYVEIGADMGDLDVQLGRVQGALAKVAAGMQRAEQEYREGKINAEQLASVQARLAATQDDLRAHYERLTVAMASNATATTQLSTASAAVATHSDRAAKSGRNLGMVLMQVGYIADDAQYGMMGLVNNVQPLTYALTGSMGVAAAVQVVTVGIYQLAKHSDTLAEAFGLSTRAGETEAEMMERLEKSTSRTADETERLNKYKKEQADIERMLSGESKEQKATEAAAQEVYNEADPRKVKKFLAQQVERRDITDAEKEEIRKAGEEAVAGAGGGELGEAMVSDAEMARRRGLAEQAKRMEIAKRIRAKAAVDAGKLMLAAKGAGPEGEAARAQIEGFVQNPAGPLPVPRGLGNIAVVGPEARRRQEALEAQAQVNAEKQEKARQRRLMLNEQGAENERLMREQQAQERSREAGRLAGAMDRTVGTQLLLDPSMGRGALEGRIKKALESAGIAADQIGKLVPEIAVQLREKMRQAVESRAAERGISADEARVQLLKEERLADAADRKRSGGASEIFSSESYANRLLMATQSGQADRIPQEQLEAQKQANETLKQIRTAVEKDKGDRVARFAGGGARR